MTTTGELSENLRNVIDRYLNGHRSRSLATLSRASGVSYTTLRRLYQREGNPTAEPVLKIIDVALSTEEKLDFIKRYYPEIAVNLSGIQADAYLSAAPRQEILKAFYVRDPHNYILNLAQNDKGTTRETVQRITGERGLEALDELVEHGILEVERVGGDTVYRLPAMLSSDCDMALAQMKLSADHFDRSLIGTKAARLFHATASIDQRTLERIHDVLSGAIKEIIELKDDPRNSGDIPLFVDMMMNIYDRSPLRRDRSDA
ncbi:MAG: hypothetical protein FJ146_02165 [Deltaproteobacteria bacterium]|nr:hypothetical protein [Deltaproteobacteria bacterium]